LGTRIIIGMLIIISVSFFLELLKRKGIYCFSNLSMILSQPEKIWVNRAKPFEEAQDFDNANYLRLSSTGRVESVQFLREEFFKS